MAVTVQTIRDANRYRTQYMIIRRPDWHGFAKSVNEAFPNAKLDLLQAPEEGKLVGKVYGVELFFERLPDGL